MMTTRLIQVILPLAFLGWGEVAGQVVGAEDVNLATMGAVDVAFWGMHQSKPLVLVTDSVLVGDDSASFRAAVVARLETFAKEKGMSVARFEEIPGSLTEFDFRWVKDVEAQGDVLYVEVLSLSYSHGLRGGPLRCGSRTTRVPMVQKGNTWVPHPTELVEQVVGTGYCGGKG